MRPADPLGRAVDPQRLDLTPEARVWVAYSGGLDSSVLLHLLARRMPDRLPDRLRAVHVHHGLQPLADDWVRHCRRVCRKLGVALRVERVTVEGRGGLEAAARTARYAAFASLLRTGDVLAVAHHRRDQAETVAMHALRGSGVAGLAAMRRLSPLGQGRLWRPLLDQPRDALHDYALSAGLSWVEDPHNASLDRARASLRAVWPALRRHFPAAEARLAQLAGHAADAQTLLAELAAIDGQTVCVATPGAGHAWDPECLDLQALRALSPARRDNLLYHVWVRRFGPAPGRDWFARLQREVLDAAADAEPVLRMGDIEARRYRQRLYLMRRLPAAPDASGIWSWRQRRTLPLPPGCGELHAVSVPDSAFHVRFNVPAARLKAVGDPHTRSLKQLCQTAGIPGWVRRRMPLVYCGDTLVAVAGYWHSAAAVAAGLPRLRWRQAPPGAPPDGR